MPKYEYRCNYCGLDFDELVNIADRFAVQCPECGRIADKKMSAPYHIFKGWDFPSNDSKRMKHWNAQAKEKQENEL